jgi:proteasome lid subunit RPN8/RPN11
MLALGVTTMSNITTILRLNTQQLELLREEARRVHPVEACAILFGKTTPREVTVKRVVTVPNVLKSTTRFEIDPKTFFDAFMQAEKDGLQFIGLFHSHPAPAYPSGVDVKFMRLWGDAVWLILSSTYDSFAAFQMIGSKVGEVTVKTDKL